MTNPIQGNNNGSILSTSASKASSSVTNPEITGMEKAPKSGLVKRLQTIANAFRSIGESVTQANSGKAISMKMSVKNLGIASSPNRSESLTPTGLKTLADHVTGMSPEKKQALVDSAVKDVANGGHNLLKLLNRNPDIFKIVVESGGTTLIEAMDTHSDKIPQKLLSAVKIIDVSRSSERLKMALESSLRDTRRVEFESTADITKWSQKFKGDLGTKEEKDTLRSVLNQHVSDFGSAELILEYGKGLPAEEQIAFVKAFTESQQAETGFTQKFNDVFKGVREGAIETGGEANAFMRGNSLYSRLATSRVSQYSDSAKMKELSESLKGILDEASTTAIEDKEMTSAQGTAIATVVSEFFNTNIATLDLSKEYKEDLKVFLAEVGEHFKAKSPQEIAVIKFQQFASDYMLRNFNPLLTNPGPDGKVSPVGLYLSKIIQNSANMVPAGFKESIPDPVIKSAMNNAVSIGINSLVKMGLLNNLFTSDEAALILESSEKRKINESATPPNGV